MATIKLTQKNAQYCERVPSQRSIRCNFGGTNQGTGWEHGGARFDVLVSIPGTDISGKMTIGDTTMAWRRHGHAESFDRLFDHLLNHLDKDVTVEVERIG